METAKFFINYFQRLFRVLILSVQNIAWEKFAIGKIEINKKRETLLLQHR